MGYMGAEQVAVAVRVTPTFLLWLLYYGFFFNILYPRGFLTTSDPQAWGSKGPGLRRPGAWDGSTLMEFM